MIARIALSVAALVAIAVAVVVSGMGGGSSFHLTMRLANADGLREGSDVKVAGTIVGRVDDLHFGPHDVVDVRLALDRHKARIGRGASVAIRAANLLGQKFVDLRPGDAAEPLASGARIPGSRIVTTVDLDQVLDVLDADTRARLGILINEAGTALTGRRADFSALVGALPGDLQRAQRIVDDLGSDNHTLRQLVARSERFISRITTDRTSLARESQVAGDALGAVAARRPELAATLRRAPGSLATLRRFLADLRATTVPLGPAARTLSAVAPALTATMSRLEPFRSAAAPVLDEARRVAPSLTSLATRATPVVRRADPTVAALDSLAASSTPFTSALGKGIDDTLGFAQGWARAIQPRDGASHVFRGQLSFSPEAINSAVRQLLRLEQRRAARRHKTAPRRPASPRPHDATTAPAPANVVPATPGAVLQRIDNAVQKIVRDVTSPAPGAGHGQGSGAKDLLDFLLKP